MTAFFRWLAAAKTNVPVYVPCFNAVSYARRMTCQLRERGFRKITLLDNGSTYPPMLRFLTWPGLGIKIIRHGENRGPRFIFYDPDLYASLPQIFCVTDPDLVFNDEMPLDFVGQLAALTEEHRIGKVGLALDISNPAIMRDEDFRITDRTYKIWEWEQRFWDDQVAQTPGGDPIYAAPVDTTFAVYNKKYFDPEDVLKALRVAGRYTCQHLPWLKDIGLTSEEEAFYRRAATTSYYLRADDGKAFNY